jgi:hypothetical protein
MLAEVLDDGEMAQDFDDGGQVMRDHDRAVETVDAMESVPVKL